MQERAVRLPLRVGGGSDRRRGCGVSTWVLWILKHELVIIIILSAENCPVLDIGLPQGSPNRSVLRHRHPPYFRDLNQVTPSCRRLTNNGSCYYITDATREEWISSSRFIMWLLTSSFCNSFELIYRSNIQYIIHIYRKCWFWNKIEWMNVIREQKFKQFLK